MSPPPRPVTPVGILAAHLERAWIRANELDDVDGALLGELRAARSLAGGLEAYIADCTTPESPTLTTLARRTRARDWEHRPGSEATVALEQEMLSGHVEGVTLRFLAKLTRARRVLEIGMFTGYSALALAEALPADGRVLACELDADAAAFAQSSFDTTPAGAKIEVRVGPALETLSHLSQVGERFDLVFIDADKRGYVSYLSAILDGELLAPNGLICADNTLHQGEPWLPSEPSSAGASIAAFNATVVGDPRLEQVLLPLRDGLTLIRRVG